MRILIAGQTYYPAFNGQAIFTINLAEGLARRGHEVMVVVPSNLGAAYQLERNSVCIQAVKSVPLNFLHPDLFYTLSPGRTISRLVRDFQPDIVHIHDHYPISVAVLRAARRHHVKAVGTNHFMPENLAPYMPIPGLLKPGMNWVLWRWMLGLYNQLDVVTAPSRTAAAIMRRPGLRRPVYPISCGVDPDRFHPYPSIDRQEWRKRYDLDPERALFLFVGRVDGEKRLDVLLEAMHLLNREDIQLGIIGKGAVLGKLKSLSEELNLTGKVHFTGFVPGEDLPALLNSADIFAMPSEAELLSIATLEAMACGLPILAAHARALPELVNEGVNGYLFQAGEAAEAARYMALLADHPERYRSMGQASLEKVQSHSLEKTLQSYEKIYDVVSAQKVPSFPFARSRSGRTAKRSTRGLVDRL
jgi:1,2-diacylglycerol 3-alpha-glucosyltransferase